MGGNKRLVFVFCSPCLPDEKEDEWSNLNRTNLVDSFIIPVRIDLAEFVGHSVVLSGHQSVHTSEYQLFVNPNFTYNDHFKFK